MNLSLGVIETYGLTAAIHAADAACKSAAVTVLGYKKIGSGLVSVFFAGEISAVKTAIDSGVAVIKQPAFIKGQLVIARPEKQVVALLTGLKGKELTPPAAKVQQEPPAPVAEVAAPQAEATAPVVETPVADNKPARTNGKKESK
ncbi:BMC domain-containing protein [Serratia fonticola]|uniref:BMC domain-containing protein n=1 Tax=Serratia fonticola TaxID=47917 RepID=UPI00301DA119